MARIRSIHPELFTDEAFMSLSMAARVFMTGLWGQCDDQGVFEWKPLTLKARIMPCDNVDCEALLSELTTANFVKAFEHFGKKYGVVRNFRKFQRPQKPTAIHPLPDAMRSYVGLLPEPHSSDPVTLQEEYDSTTVKSPQMESRVEEGSVGEGRKTRAPEDFGFEKFWDAYPKRQGDPEGAAELAWDEAAKRPDFPGVDAIVAALSRWKTARKLESDPPFAPYAKTWLAEKRWNDWPAPPPPEPHKRDWAEAYPDTWGKLKASLTPNEWAFWLGKCTINGPPHVLYTPDKFTREKVETKYGAQIAAMFGGKGTVRVLGEIQQGAAA